MIFDNLMQQNSQQHLERLKQALILSLRAQLNKLLGGLGVGLASGGGSLVSIVLLVFLGANLFLFLNIALGFWLGEWAGGSPALGFLMLAGLYALMMLVYTFVLRQGVERKVRNGVAGQFLELGDRVNAELDNVEALRVAVQPYVKPKQPEAYIALEVLKVQSTAQAQQASQELKGELGYLKDNYKYMAGDIAQERIMQRYPAYRYIAPVMSLFLPRQVEVHKPREGEVPRQRVVASPATSRVARAVQPYVSYLGFAFDVLKPVLMTVLVSRTQSALLGFFGIKSKKRK